MQLYGHFTHLVSHKGLLNGSEVLQGREKHVPIFWTAYVLHESSQLITERREHLIFVFYRFYSVISLLHREGEGELLEAYRQEMVSAHLLSALGQAPAQSWTVFEWH